MSVCKFKLFWHTSSLYDVTMIAMRLFVVSAAQSTGYYYFVMCVKKSVELRIKLSDNFNLLKLRVEEI